MDANDAAGRLAVVWALLKQDDPEGTDELTRAVETTALRQVAQARAEELARKDEAIAALESRLAAVKVLHDEAQQAATDKDELIRELANVLEMLEHRAIEFTVVPRHEIVINNEERAKMQAALRKAGRL